MPFLNSATFGTLVIFLSLSACEPAEYMSESDLTTFVSQDDHLSKTISSNQITIRVTYKPTDLLVAQELKSVQDPSVHQITAARDKYKNYYYFIISFSHSDKEVLNPSLIGQSNFSDLLQTMSFGMGELVNLTTSANDTIPVADYVQNRTFGLSKSTDMLFVFDRMKARDSEWIQINLEEFVLGTGIQSLRFLVRDLETTPKIYKL